MKVEHLVAEEVQKEFGYEGKPKQWQMGFDAAFKRIWEAFKQEIEILEAMTRPGKSPCGHSQDYAYTDDGGKTIICLVCSRELLERERRSQFQTISEQAHVRLRLEKRIDRLKAEIESVASKQRQALDNKGWGHAAWCNYSIPFEGQTFCNCGLANLQHLAEQVKGDKI